MQEVKTSLNEIVQIRKVAIATLRDLMAKHELDDRYQNKVKKSDINLFFITIIFEVYIVYINKMY